MVTEMDRTVFVCVPANPMFQASWLSNFSVFTIGPNNYYLLVEDVEHTLPVSCSINGIIASSILSVQGEVLKMYIIFSILLTLLNMQYISGNAMPNDQLHM